MSKVVMTSREMASLTGKTHGNLLSSLRRYISRGELNLEESTYMGGAHGNTKAPEFRMTKQQVIEVMDKLSSRDRKVLSKHLGIKALPLDASKPAEVVTQSPAMTVQQPLALNAVLPVSDVVTMSSVEIAELADKDHKHVMRDIRKMLEDLGEDEPKFGSIYLDAYKREKPCFSLPRDLTETLITGYNVPLRHRVVVRLRELESEKAKQVSPALPNFGNPAEAARAWATEFEGRTLALEVVKIQEQKIAENAPKVEFYEDVAVAEGCQTVKQVADELGVGRNSLYKYLRKHKILIEHGKDHNSPYQVQKDAGRFTVVLEPYPHPHTGKIEFGALTMVTGKGLIFIRELIAKHGRAGLTKD